MTADPPGCGSRRDAPVVVRAALPGEGEALSAIARAAKQVWGYPAAQIDAWRAALTVSEAQIAQGVALVAEAGGKVCAVAVAMPGEPWKLEHLWVVPAMQRKGLGGQLLERARTEVGRRGGAGLRVVSDPFAAGFYSRAGAVPAGHVAAPLPDEPERALPVFLLPTPHASA